MRPGFEPMKKKGSFGYEDEDSNYQGNKKKKPKDKHREDRQKKERSKYGSEED